MPLGTRGYTAMKTSRRRRRFRGRRRGKGRKFVKAVRRVVNDKLLEHANYYVIKGSNIQTLIGQQSYGFICGQNTSADLNNIYAKITSPVSGGQPSSTLKSMRYTITGYVANIRIKNQEQVNTIVDMYCIVPRQDTTDTPTSVFSSGLSDQGAPASSDLVIGVTPYMSSAFCALYKIIKRQTFLLTPGSHEVITFKDRKNYNIDQERLNSNSTTSAFRRLTKYWFIFQYGEPVHDKITPTNVSTAATSVDYVVDETYFYTFMPMNVVQTTTSLALGTITTASSVLQETGAIVQPPLAA